MQTDAEFDRRMAAFLAACPSWQCRCGYWNGGLMATCASCGIKGDAS